MADEPGIIIVTGSNGRIGDAVMQRFGGRFDQVVGFDRKAPTPPPPGCVHVPVDVTSAESVMEGLTVIREHHGNRVAAVVHLAAYYDFLGAPSPRYDQITVEGTRRLLRGLHELEFQVEQFIFSSTMLVHRPVTPGEFISEDSPIEATWAYPASKVRTEQVIADERGDIPAVVLRIAGVFDDEGHSIPLAHQMQRIYERWLTARVYSGSTAHGQSFLHMDDLVDAIEAVVIRRRDLPNDVPLPLLLGESDPLSYDELQHTLTRLIHDEIWAETLEIPIPLAPFAKFGTWVLNRLPGRDIFLRPWMISRANDHYALDLTRAHALLGWVPQRTLRATMPKMVDALKRNPLGWYAENDLEPSRSMRKRAPAPQPDEDRMGNHAEQKPLVDREPMGDMPGMGAPTPDVLGTMGQATPSAHFFASIILGIWLVTSPFALGYGSAELTASDVISGLLIVGFATITLLRKSAWAPWAGSLVGVWLLFAPLIFKAPTAAAYANDTLAGALVIAFVLLMPGMPGTRMVPGPDIPRGWSYNPSSWPQRAPIIVLALIGFFLSRQMAAYQLGYTTIVWEPFFHPGTAAVLTSKVSQSFPISDAGFGAMAYMIEALMGFMGDKRRWRTMPWMVAFFGVLVVPLGFVSIALIILQPVSVGQWCTPCLIAASAMLIMIALTLDEVVATITFLIRATREGQPFWRTFWLGGALATPDQTATRIRPAGLSVKAMFWGVAVPWNLALSVALGVWLMFAPSVFGTTGLAAHSDHILGALVITVAIIAMADVGRILRRINIIFGLWFIVSPWFLGGGSTPGLWNDVAVGVLLILLSLRRGPIRDQYGTWQRHIR